MLLSSFITIVLIYFTELKKEEVLNSTAFIGFLAENFRLCALNLIFIFYLKAGAFRFILFRFGAVPKMGLNRNPYIII